MFFGAKSQSKLATVDIRKEVVLGTTEGLLDAAWSETKEKEQPTHHHLSAKKRII